jgi:secreted trypsin-like serine protease
MIHANTKPAFLLLATSVAALICLNQYTLVQAQSRIVGGTPTGTNDYPYYAFPAGTNLCGATLIWTDILMSAAHCGVKGTWNGGILLGGNSLTGSSSTFYSTNKTLIHPNYNNVTAYNDIMLFKINGLVPAPYAQLNFNATVPQTGDLMTAIGYGYTSENGNPSFTLLKVDLPAANYTECAQYFPVDYNIQVCNRGLPEGGKDTCNGDSGGPLFVNGTNIQVGIVAMGRGCARPNVPAVNTRVSAYQTWINTNICSMSSSPPTSCPSKAPVRPPTRAPTKQPVPTPCRLLKSICTSSTQCCSKKCSTASPRRCIL